MASATPKPTMHGSRRTPAWMPSPLWIFVSSMVSIFVGVGLWVAIPIYREQAAHREIERVGGRFETYSGIHEVALDDSQATDTTLAYLPRLPKFESLLLDNTNVTDAGLSHVASLTGLQHLRLNNTRVTDAGLTHLTGLKNLKALSLDHTQVTDAGLVYLRQLNGLDFVRLSDTKVTENGIAMLRHLLRTTEVVVDRVLAAPPDPVPPETAIVRFRFRHTSGRAQTKDGFEELPETECGELLFERNTGRCVYRYWYDGVHERRSGNWPGDGEVPKQRRDSPNHVLLPLKGAAAFDGKRYWAASYDQLRPRLHADRVVIYDGGEDLRKRDWADRPSATTPSWYDWAPLHALAAVVRSDAIERDKLHRAIQVFPQAEKYGPYAYSLTVAGWHYVVSIDESDSGIRRVEVSLAGGWGGQWPFPVPSRYSMERENADDIDSERLDGLADVAAYIDDSTVVRE